MDIEKILIPAILVLAVLGVILLFIYATPTYDGDCLNKIALEHCSKNNCEVIEIHKGEIHIAQTDIFDFNTRHHKFIKYSKKEMDKCKIK